ncbi:MAG: polysulfide reductase NrfD [Phycisphaerae bacterium]|nr:polysulfide reductase NrfD [Phycisphaerae bacterium]
MGRAQTLKVILWGVAGLGLAVIVHRMIYGLGATTNLSDGVPWGLWKGVSVIAGIAMAAGGFVLTGVIHIFRLHRFHALVRPAVITALMGYGSAATVLMFDIGLPWRIWHPVVYWQIHSPLFEVAWCVMLYLTLLTLEFSPIVMEYFDRWRSLAAWMVKWLSLPLAILGVMISTLHQSTLGTIFLITAQLHPLWYSPIQPILFITSAAGLGMMVIVVEFIIVPWLYHKPIDLPMLSSLARAACYTLWGYFVLRLIDVIFLTGSIVHVTDGSWESFAFILEMVVGVVIPCVLLLMPRVRSNVAGLLGCAALVLIGLLFQRIAVSGLAMLRASGGGYFPSWSEFGLSAGILAAAGLVFLFAVERFAIWTPRITGGEFAPPAPTDIAGEGWIGMVPAGMFKNGSLAFVLGASVAIGLLPFKSARSEGLIHTPTYPARGEQDGVLLINGNRDGTLVKFNHGMHIKENGGETESCKRCHHMNVPLDKNTGCFRCHADMYLPTSIFSHDRHVEVLGMNRSCHECHPSRQGRTGATAKACAECHNEKELALKVPGATVKSDGDVAVSYTNAMHDLCITCHAEVATKRKIPHHDRCDTCHKPGVDIGGPAQVVTRGGDVFSRRSKK